MAKTTIKEGETLIEDLKYEKQMDNLQPWIKALYKQAEKDPTNPGGWSKWSLRAGTRNIEQELKTPGTPWPLTYQVIGVDPTNNDVEGGCRQEYLYNLMNTDENKNYEKFVVPLLYPLTKKTYLTEEEKRFVLLCNTVLGLEITEEEFLKMSEGDREDLRDRILGI